MLMRYEGEARPLVSKPDFSDRDGACWFNRVPTRLKQLVKTFRRCGNKARPGKLTCNHHAAHEEAAQTKAARP